MRRCGGAGWWLAAPPLVGMVAVLVVTGKGLYVSPDSVSYVGIARSLLDGGGWSPPPGLPPVGHFPPLFTLVLAGVGRLGLDPLDAARLVNAVAFGAVIALVGVVLWRRTSTVAAALVGSVLVLASVDLLTFSAAALTEPLFILLAMAGLVALAVHLDHRRPGLLVVAAALVAMAVLTRYVGVALVVAGTAALVRFGAKRRVHGVVDALVFAVIAVVPVLAWAVWARTAETTEGDRSAVLHLPDADYLGQAVRPLARWVVPFVPPTLGLALAALVVVAGWTVVRRERLSHPPAPSAAQAAPSAAQAAPSVDAPEALAALPWLLGAFAVAYLAVLIADRAVLDVSGRLDSRFLAPLHVVAVLLVVPPLHRVLRAGTAPAVAVAGAAVLVVLLLADAAVWTARGVTDVSVRRRGYTAVAWQRSEVVAAVASADPGEPVWTNGFDAVFLLTGRATRPLPAEENYLTGRANPDYAHELAAMQGEGGLVAYFGALTARESFLPSQAELERALPLQRVTSDEVGTLYRLAP